MNRIKSRFGFTLTELLVTIVILGIITGLSVPIIRNIQRRQVEKKYTTYMDSLNYATKLYVDSYAEDLFGHGSRGCAYVDLTELEGRNLAKDIDMRNVSCKSNFTLVKVVKFKEQYYYKSYIGCGPKKGATVEPDVFKPEKVERSELCNGEFDKTVLINADPATVTDATNQDVSPIITVSSETGVNRTTDLKYGWSYAEGDHNIIGGESAWQDLTFNIPTKRSQIKMIQRSETQTFASKTSVESPNVTGDVWLVIKVVFLEDLDGVNWQTVNNEEDSYVYIGPFRLDNSPPEVTNVTVSSSDPNFQHQKADVSFTAVDHQYTEQNNLKVCIVANHECENSDYKPFRDSDTIKVANDYDGGTYQVYIGVKDEAGNTTELPPVSYQVYRRCSVAIPKENWRDITQCTKKCIPPGGTAGTKKQECDMKDKFLEDLCEGKAEQTVTCNDFDCCSQTDLSCGNWTNSGTCSKKCTPPGGTPGTQKQVRTCNNVSHFDSSIVCSANTSTSNTTQNIVCNDFDCCRETTRNEGSWSSWSTCTKKCIMSTSETPGTQKQTRLITNISTADPSVTCSTNLETNTRNCNNTSAYLCCSSANIQLSCGAWEPYGQCSKACEGTYSRTRICNNVSKLDGRVCSANTDPANTTQTSSCGPTCCSSVTTTYGNWSAWTTCTKNCGDGVHSRTRTVTKKSTYDNRTCSSTTETETGSCPIPAVDCCAGQSTETIYGNWSAWSGCTKACVADGESAGTEKRTRVVTVKSTLNGTVCSTKTETETRACSAPKCCSSTSVSCGAWGNYTTCTKECGSGTHTRTRTCNNVSTYDGRVCSANTNTSNTTETSSCNTQACCSSVTYKDGTTCSKKCGTDGTYNRLAYSAYDGSRCSANDKTSGGSACNRFACCASGHITYKDGTTCTKKCGSGTYNRLAYSAYDGSRCSSFDASSGGSACNTQACCSSVTYKDGTTCTKKCGSGTYNRLAYSAYDGSRCSSKDTSSGGSKCNTQTCCSKTSSKSCGSWGSWGSCSKKCGGGTKKRTRKCKYYSYYDSSVLCDTKTETDSASCNTQGCCSSTTTKCNSWGSWGSCSKQCGGGTHKRTRKCTRYSSYNSSACSSYTETDSGSCNTRGCCSKTTSSCSRKCTKATANLKNCYKTYKTTCKYYSVYNGSYCKTTTSSSTTTTTGWATCKC